MYLGLDLGTSGLKALLVDDAQRVVGEGVGALSVRRPHDGWSEQAPSSWIEACRKACAGLDLSGVRAVGLSGQMHGATLLGADDAPLRPCMLWNDTRAHAEAAELDDDEARRITGNIVFPGFTAPKALWVARHEPAVWARVRRVLLPKDYLRIWLTGEAVGEMSDAGGTAWLETGARRWSDRMLERTGLSRDAMPRLVEGSEVSGHVRDAVAAELGLPRGVPVAGGGGDNAAAAVGAGIVRPGTAFASLGTSGVLFAATQGYAPAPKTAVHTFPHAVPGGWHQMGVILAATDALEWLSRMTGRGAADLTADLGELRAPGRALFLPYLGGERTPHNDAALRGAFLGLSHATGPEEAARAVLEGVAFAFADCADALAATGTRIERLLGIGGGSRSAYWCGAVATALGIAVERPVAGDFGGAFGAARLAMMADGAGAAVATVPPIADVVEPLERLRDAFAEGHARYRAAHDAVRAL
ncbi:xylulokinase [Hasllibacter halocynthiae]|uniref:Xylulose kinase n=1 Tax=Hasllibacter halocynthiae TaxID=595589 RepID=A0A2T0X2W1_9RHOB|nr:xylulokinase [Hasllibacter halocynthiae]PRY93292.1 xylulokinase [Hasllibacter halocynthiae]